MNFKEAKGFFGVWSTNYWTGDGLQFYLVILVLIHSLSWFQIGRKDPSIRLLYCCDPSWHWAIDGSPRTGRQSVAGLMHRVRPPFTIRCVGGKQSTWKKPTQARGESTNCKAQSRLAVRRQSWPLHHHANPTVSNVYVRRPKSLNCGGHVGLYH